MISWFHEFEARFGFRAGSESAWDSLSPSLSAPPPLALSVSLKINKLKKNANNVLVYKKSKEKE